MQMNKSLYLEKAKAELRKGAFQRQEDGEEGGKRSSPSPGALLQANRERGGCWRQQHLL